jgi:hypothetical protein
VSARQETPPTTGPIIVHAEQQQIHSKTVATTDPRFWPVNEAPHGPQRPVPALAFTQSCCDGKADDDVSGEMLINFLPATPITAN